MWNWDIIIIIIIIVVVVSCLLLGSYYYLLLYRGRQRLRAIQLLAQGHTPVLFLLHHAAFRLKGPCELAFHSLLPGNLPLIS